MKKFIKKLFQYCGLDIKKASIEGDFMKSLTTILRFHKIDLVLDIGGNVGQFSKNLRSSGYQNQIISFEPLLREHLMLKDIASDDPKWKIYERCAVGAYDGDILINVAKNSVSSSILPMLDAHLKAAKSSIYVGEEITPIRTLDSIFDNNKLTNCNFFIKIDTQGYEEQVLDGGQAVIPNATGILVELTTTPLYCGQILWKSLVERIEKYGFSLWSINPGFTDPETGQLLQFDAVFMRAK